MSDSDQPPLRHSWAHLNHLQTGRYAEYLVKMEFTRLGFSVFGAEVDDRGIDLVIRTDDGRHFDIQVKSARSKSSYIFFPKDKFPLADSLFAVVALFLEDEEPHLYMIPSIAWRKPNDLLRDRDYGHGRKSKPEWGINISRRNLPLLEQFAFEAMARRYMVEA